MILHELISYDVLRLIWWALLGVLLIGFALTDGFDLGTGTLLPFVARSDVERRVVINTIGPVWEGNQVWLILGGGAIFAAFPPLYAVSFSGFYIAMFLILFALILRPVGFKFRSKVPDPDDSARLAEAELDTLAPPQASSPERDAVLAALDAVPFIKAFPLT